MQYLVNKYGADDPAKETLYPSDPEIRANVDRLLFFDIGCLYKSLVDFFVSSEEVCYILNNFKYISAPATDVWRTPGWKESECP